MLGIEAFSADQVKELLSFQWAGLCICITNGFRLVSEWPAPCTWLHCLLNALNAVTLVSVATCIFRMGCTLHTSLRGKSDQWHAVCFAVQRS